MSGGSRQGRKSAARRAGSQSSLPRAACTAGQPRSRGGREGRRVSSGAATPKPGARGAGG